MGGYLPYRLGLQLDKTHARYIDDVIEIEGNDLVKMELQNPGEDAPAIFIFTGTEQLRKRNNGGTFYNTEPDHAIANNFFSFDWMEQSLPIQQTEAQFTRN
jgi:hypothetical protein